MQIQSVGASAEYGNMQGAVVNVITRQGSERFLYDAAYYCAERRSDEPPGRAALRRIRRRRQAATIARGIRDFTTNLGGPVVRERLWFFAGYQYLRDHDSQPGTDPARPRTYEQDKVFAKLTWKFTPRLRLEQSFHDEFGLNPDRPTIVTPFEAISRRHVSVPAMTFGHLTHTASTNTVWDVRVGRFVYSQDDESPTGDLDDREPVRPCDGVTSGGPPRMGSRDDHAHDGQGDSQPLPAGPVGRRSPVEGRGQVERGEHEPSAPFRPACGTSTTTANRSSPSRAIRPISAASRSPPRPSPATRSRMGNRLTINAGCASITVAPSGRTCPRSMPKGDETDAIVHGLGHMYTWNIVSPRLGLTTEAQRRRPDGPAGEATDASARAC